VFLLRKPSDERIRAFLAAQDRLEFTYPEVGASRGEAPPGYPINHRRDRLGTGKQGYARAVSAVQRWQMYALPWTDLCWPSTPIRPDETVVVLAHHLGMWSLNASKIIYTIEEVGPVHRYGFAFGTLPGHVERGEERFTVEWHEEDDAVWYEIFAFASPRHPLARLGYPVVRWTQRRFAAASVRAMRAAVARETV
jgi:uncharacterized protein (UPF0548 family)